MVKMSPSGRPPEGVAYTQFPQKARNCPARPDFSSGGACRESVVITLKKYFHKVYGSVFFFTPSMRQLKCETLSSI